jgi:CrcB protein
MDRLNTYVLDFLGAGLGGVLRHALNNAAPGFLGGACPFVTQIINITGSMAMRFLIGCLALTRSI